MTQAADLLVPTHFDAPVEHGSNYSGDTQTRCSRGIPRPERAGRTPTASPFGYV